jgi:hypothetical protein
MTVYIYLGGPCSLLSQKCFLSTKVDKSTGVASVYPSYSNNMHLLSFYLRFYKVIAWNGYTKVDPKIKPYFSIPVMGSFPIYEVIFRWFLGKPLCRKHCV